MRKHFLCGDLGFIQVVVDHIVDHAQALFEIPSLSVDDSKGRIELGLVLPDVCTEFFIFGEMYQQRMNFPFEKIEYTAFVAGGEAELELFKLGVRLEKGFIHQGQLHPLLDLLQELFGKFKILRQIMADGGRALKGGVTHVGQAKQREYVLENDIFKNGSLAFSSFVEHIFARLEEAPLYNGMDIGALFLNDGAHFGGCFFLDPLDGRSEHRQNAFYFVCRNRIKFAGVGSSELQHANCFSLLDQGGKQHASDAV